MTIFRIFIFLAWIYVKFFCDMQEKTLLYKHSVTEWKFSGLLYISLVFQLFHFPWLNRGFCGIFIKIFFISLPIVSTPNEQRIWDRIIEGRKDLSDSPVQPPLCSPLDPVPKCHTQVVFIQFQGEWLHHFTGKPIRVRIAVESISHPRWKSAFMKVQ